MKKVIKKAAIGMVAFFVVAASGPVFAAVGDQGVDWSKYNGYQGNFGYASDELREDLKESREQRKENEGKLFGIADDHTKQLYNHEGRLNTLETITSSSVMRIDRAEKELQGE